MRENWPYLVIGLCFGACLVLVVRAVVVWVS